MQFEYKTKGTCSQKIFITIEDGKIVRDETRGEYGDED